MSELVLLDEAVGETRVCRFDEQGQPLELGIERCSEQMSRLVTGSAHLGRVIRVENNINAAFVELPIGDPGFLPFGRKGRPASVHEGAKIPVLVTREALPGKGPNLVLTSPQQVTAPAPTLTERMNLPETARIIPADRAGRERIDEAIEQALARQVAIPDGGDICIEQTRALVAIDVDTGNSPVTGGKFNHKAAQVIFRHLRLRSAGGIIVIDFAPMKSKNERNALWASITSLAKKDPARIDVLPLSRFGTMELLRRKNVRSPDDIMLDENGKKTVETVALEALRALENEALAQGGARLELQAGIAVFNWLQQDNIGWHAAMTKRIGPRFCLQCNNDLPRQKYEVIGK